MDLLPLFRSPEAPTAIKLSQRRERVFMILAGIFLGTLGIINLLGLSRFVDLTITFGEWSIPMVLPLGVLPYPVTFLCTDIISEFYGKEKANLVVWIGLMINLWIIFILWLSGILPPEVPMDPVTNLPPLNHPDHAFYKIRVFTMGGVIGSMIAYLVAQLLDVHLFHFWKDFTAGKHLWLRNNASTLVSQFLDTVIVITVAYYLTDALPLTTETDDFTQLKSFILCSYTFKAIMALLDTIPFYIAVFYLRKYLGLTPSQTNAKYSPNMQSP
ncbi:MAG: queuosine precursor transporter [Candidatus Berkiellales bacterium]